VLQHVHSWPAYLTLGLTVTLLAMVVTAGLRQVRGPVILLLAVEVAQMAVGISQSRLGLPEILVGLHMVLACILVAAMTTVVLAMRGRTSVDPRSAGSGEALREAQRPAMA
jgi:cytochrome c oxidase assembly protein subunit 15